MPVTYDTNRVSLPRYVKSKDVCEVLKITHAGLMGLVERGEFPAPIRVGRRMLRWDAAELKEWFQAGCPATSEKGQ